MKKHPRDFHWLIDRPIAHRGLHDKEQGIIENTSDAFAAALSHNYAIECDLQISADGEAMVFHDETLDRLCEGSGLLKEKSAAELKRIKFKQTSTRMQTFAELLEQVDQKVTLVIELKSHWDGDTALVYRTCEVLKTYKGPYALMSFDPDIVEAIRAVSPNTIRGITADRATDEYYDGLPEHRRRELQGMTHLERTQPHFASFYFRDLPFEPIDQMRKAGKPVISWTIRSAEDAKAARLHSDQVTFEGYLDS